MAMAGVDYVMGAQQQLIRLPDYLRGQVRFLGASIGVYRLFIVVICAVLALALQLVLVRTRFGSRLRAAVDDPAAAPGLGIVVGTIFATTFAAGPGLARPGGTPCTGILGLSPTSPHTLITLPRVVGTGGGTN